MICSPENKMKVPTGGFFFVVEFDEQTVSASNFKELLTRVANYYRFENQDIPSDLENEIICQICYRSKQWCKAEKSEGLGDTIHKVAQRIGMAPLAARVQSQRLTGCKTCGQRQKYLNKRFPYRG